MSTSSFSVRTSGGEGGVHQGFSEAQSGEQVACDPSLCGSGALAGSLTRFHWPK